MSARYEEKKSTPEIESKLAVCMMPEEYKRRVAAGLPLFSGPGKYVLFLKKDAVTKLRTARTKWWQHGKELLQRWMDLTGYDKEDAFGSLYRFSSYPNKEWFDYGGMVLRPDGSIEMLFPYAPFFKAERARLLGRLIYNA